MPSTLPNSKDGISFLNAYEGEGRQRERELNQLSPESLLTTENNAKYLTQQQRWC